MDQRSDEESWLCPGCGFTVEASDPAFLATGIRMHESMHLVDSEIPRS